MIRLAVSPVRLAAAVLSAGVALSLAGCDRLPKLVGVHEAAAPTLHFNAVDLTGAEYAQDFHLPDPDGKVRSLADFRGKDVVVFFGYTHCPDACPTTLADLAAARQAMGADGAKVQVVFITVDPERDSPAILKAYTEGFGKDVIGLRGDAAQTRDTARAFKVFYAKVPGKTPGDYTMDHTAGSYVYDPAGRLRLFIRTGQTPPAIAEDLETLIRTTPAA